MRALALVFIFAACHGKPKPPSKVFGETCGSDTECVSGRCLPGSGATSFCTQSCAADTDCGAGPAVYCCEASGDKNLCTIPPGGACRQAVLGDICASATDPFCVRAGLTCAQVDSTREICTKPCASSSDCSAVTDAECTNVNGTPLCVPPDPNTVRTSNCGGDSDCASGLICQFLPDNDANPTGLVMQCTDLARGTVHAYGACTQNQDCDRGYCLSGFCPATCVNDSYCQPGFICTPLHIVVRQDDPSTAANEQIVSVIGLCAKQPGSLTACDREEAANCPAGESCGFIEHFDQTLATRCETAGGAVVAGDTCSASQSCATVLQADIDACFQDSGAQNYCVAPCRSDADCPSTRASDGTSIAMACLYEPFEPLCQTSEFNPAGKADGSACAAASAESADAQCASYYCNDSGICAPRKAAGASCARQDECESLVCLASTCQELCRDDSECGAGICSATPFRIDVADTPENASDDRYDLPTVCQAIPSPRVACDNDNDCSGAICRTVFNRDGTVTGVCAPPPAGGVILGEPCASDAACNSNLCLGATPLCSGACADDSDCAGATVPMRCTPSTLFGTAVDSLCLATVSTRAADGAACALFSDCQSNLCAEGVCVPRCPKTAHAGDAFGSGGAICVPVPVSVDARFTTRTSDDLVGYVLAAVESSACQAGDDCVYRPTSTTALAGYVLTPNPDARANGQPCQLAVNCQSGLCVAGVCVAPCAGTCADPTQVCNASALALTYEGAPPAAVSACSKSN